MYGICISCLAGAVVITGCSSAPRGTTIHVGMPFKEAESILKANGSKETMLQVYCDKSAPALPHFYEFPNGNLLEVAVLKIDGRVVGLILCKDPDPSRGKMLGERKEIERLDLRKHGS